MITVTLYLDDMSAIEFIYIGKYGHPNIICRVVVLIRADNPCRTLGEALAADIYAQRRSSLGG